MALTFLAPAFLWLLAALPLVVVLHFLRSRRRQLDVSALFLWQRAKSTIARRRIFSPTWLLVAQLAFTALAALALARPALVPRAAPDRVVIIDASASLAATTDSGTRFDAALATARPLLEGAGRLALIRAGMDARLELPLEAGLDERLAALDSLVPGDATSDMGRALALGQALLPEAEVHVVTDQELAVGRATVHTVGSAASNVGISALDIGIGQVFVAVVASGNRPVEVGVGLYRDEAQLAGGSVLVPSGGTGSITFPLDDLGGIIEARLDVPPGDALALDDFAFTGSRPVTVVTDDDHGALTRALEAVPNTSVRFSVGARLVEADLRVLTRGFAEDKTPGNYLIFAPVAEAPVYQVVRDWDRAHPLLRFVDLRDLVVGLDPARPALAEADGWQVLARTADLAPVLRVRDAEGIWEVEAAFHPSQTDLILRPAFP
ncbi:MAG TPA: BatA and WFA domain-containing protein, partial [Trueperaceae bacterium]|nr:BatA and WFA domain-containing protein [Trueperaceae bacterium]